VYQKHYIDVARFDRENKQQDLVCTVLCRLLNERGVPYRHVKFKKFTRVTTHRCTWFEANRALEAAMMYVIEGGK